MAHHGYMAGKGGVANSRQRSQKLLGAESLATEAAQAETSAEAKLHEEQRRRQALEINDNVVQGLTVAKYALDAGNHDEARRAIEHTLVSARQIMTELLEAGEENDLRLVAGDLVRLEPATVVLAPSE